MAHMPYENVVGHFMYDMVYTRPYISHAMRILSRYMSTPGNEHWIVVKSVFRYLFGTTYFSIFYHGNSKEVRVHGFFDSEWDGDINGRRSTNGYVFRLFGGSISWMRRKQSMVAFSRTKVEYIIATHAIKEEI